MNKKKQVKNRCRRRKFYKRVIKHYEESLNGNDKEIEKKLIYYYNELKRL